MMVINFFCVRPSEDATDLALREISSFKWIILNFKTSNNYWIYIKALCLDL